METIVAPTRQADLIRRAEDLFPGGVNSPVRAFRSVGRAPLVLESGNGPRVRDADGRWCLDYIGAWGPAILGHADPEVVEAVRAAALDGFALGATSPREVPPADHPPSAPWCSISQAVPRAIARS